MKRRRRRKMYPFSGVKEEGIGCLDVARCRSWLRIDLRKKRMGGVFSFIPLVFVVCSSRGKRREGKTFPSGLMLCR
jgi:hypothetical protein